MHIFCKTPQYLIKFCSFWMTKVVGFELPRNSKPATFVIQKEQSA